ncbi:unnamed protein product, partial [Meganyctiphanes norvegica]
YIIQLRGLTGKGFGPLSEPLMVATSEMGNVDTYGPSPPVFVPPISSNGYLVISIASAALGVFTFLAIIIFCIYKRLYKSKCQHYHNKGEGSTPWTDYPGCYGDANGGLTSSMYSDAGNHGASVHGKHVAHLCQQPSALLHAKPGYERTLPDGLYEDLDGYRLASFRGNTSQ